MKKYLLLGLLMVAAVCQSQSVVQSVNSGSLITSASSVSIGEIVVSQSNGQSTSGLIGILAQLNSTLEVTQFEISDNITVFPNPSVSKIYFDSKQNLSDKNVSVFNNAGQLALRKQIGSDQSLDLSSLPSGIYLIQFSDKNLKSFKIIKH